MNRSRILVALTLSLTCCLLVGFADDDDDDDERGERGRKAQVQAIADALKKGDAAKVKMLTQRAGRGEEAVEHVMELLEKRERKGFGARVSFSRRQPESVEKLIEILASKELTAAQLKENAEALSTMGYRTAAVGKICEGSPPRRDRGKKTKKRWLSYAGTLHDGSMDLVKAVGAKSTEDVRISAVRIKGSCNSCHEVFKD